MLTPPISQPHDALTQRLRQLEADTIQAIGVEFTKKMAHADAPPEPVLPLRHNAGRLGTRMIGGVMQRKGGKVVATFRGGQGVGQANVALNALPVQALLDVLGQMSRGEYLL